MASDCVYIGDTEVDLETARNAGMDCIPVSWGFRTEEQLCAAGAEEIIRSPEELKKKLLG
jgi:phosphoglycolate phosphatase